MELTSLLRRMQSCNELATLDISTNCKHEVTLTWFFMGVSHSVKHLRASDISGDSIPFQRALHMARAVMRCRMNLRKLYQANPTLHARIMRGAYKCQ